jgi:hypothetical protein
MRKTRALLCAAFFGAIAARAADAPAPPSAAWPPSAQVRERMHELQATLQDPAATPDARRAARAELVRLLRSPGAAPVDPDRPHPARASVPPMPAQSPVPVQPAPDLPRPPVATVTAVPRSPPPIDPKTGRPLVPGPGSAIDPVTGRVLPAVPGGYVDPTTGRFVPGR